MKMYTLQGETFLVHDGKVYVELDPLGESKQQKSQNRICGLCHKPGHRKENCPDAISTS